MLSSNDIFMRTSRLFLTLKILAVFSDNDFCSLGQVIWFSWHEFNYTEKQRAFEKILLIIKIFYLWLKKMGQCRSQDVKTGTVEVTGFIY